MIRGNRKPYTCTYTCRLHRLTTYTADSHPNSTDQRQRNSVNVNCYKNAEDTQKKQTVIKFFFNVLKNVWTKYEIY